MKKNILQISNTLSIGGTERTMQIFAKSLNREKYNLFVCGFFASGVRETYLRSFVDDVLLPFGDIEIVKQFLVERNIHIIHWYGMPKGDSPEKIACLSILEFCKREGIFVIETELFSSIDKDLENFTDLRLFISHTSIDKLLYTSKSIVKSTSQYGVLYCPLDIQALESYKLSPKDRLEKRRSIGITDNTIVLGKICRSHLWKWDDAIIDVTSKLVHMGYPIKTLVRAVPAIKKEKIRKLGLVNNFIYQDETADDRELAEYSYQMMDIMVHTSRIGESFGMTLSEGMFFGLPIITNATDFREFTLFERDNSQTEIVQNGFNGFIETSSSAMVDRIIELLENSTLFSTITSNNYEYASRVFGNLMLTEKLEQVLDTLSIPEDMRYNREKISSYTGKTSILNLVIINLKALYEKFRYHC